MAFCTPVRIRSSSDSTSSGSTTVLSILIESTSPAPLAVTVTLPPPAVAVTVLSASSAWACAICSCILAACCIIFLRFIMEFDLGGEYLGFEFGQRFLDEGVVLEGFHRIDFRLRFGLLARELFH